MSGLRLLELVLVQGDKSRKFGFRRDITVFSGPISSGKSSLFELVKFSLGDEARLTEAVRDSVDRVSSRWSFFGSDASFTRSVPDGDLQVTVDGSETETIKPGGAGVDSAGLFLMKLARLPTVSTRKKGGKKLNVNFYDYLRFFYLEQREVDRSVVRHDDKTLSPRRKYTAQVIFGLATPELSNAELALADKLEEVERGETFLEQLRDFLDKVGLESPVELARMRSDAEASIEDLEEKVRRIKQGIRDRTQVGARQRRRIGALQQQLDRLEHDRELARAKASSLLGLSAQLQLDRERLEKSNRSRRLLGTIPYRVCPACTQPIERHSSQPDDCCDLCGRMIEAHARRKPIRRKDERLAAQQMETEELAKEEQKRFAELSVECSRVGRRIRAEQDRLEALVRQQVSPSLGLIEELALEIGVRRQTLAVVRENERHLAELKSEAEGLEEAKREVERLGDLIRSLKDDSTASENLEELSEIFEEIAAKTGLWTSGATFIDTKRFMPVLNGTEFDKLSAGGGGVPALVNDAFYMSLLVFGARNLGASNLPAFLMLDNPFKAVGSTGSDKEKIESFGSYVATISDAYPGRFQLLVAENDVPVSLREVSEVVEFSYDEPLIPWRSHPGDPEEARPLD